LILFTYFEVFVSAFLTAVFPLVTGYWLQVLTLNFHPPAATAEAHISFSSAITIS
jgi:hypothetical protein